MAKIKKPAKPQNLPAVGKLYTIPSDNTVLKFAGLTSDNLLKFDYVQCQTKTQPLTTTEADFAEKLRRGIFQPIKTD